MYKIDRRGGGGVQKSYTRNIPPDPTMSISRFETESATTEPQKLAEFMFSFCLIDCHKCADTFLNAAIYSINFSTLKSGRLYLTS